ETGHAAIVSLDSSPPDAILLDLHLPDMDGLEVAQAMRASRMGSQLRIYALTASSDPALARAALAAGVNDVLVKPIDEATLVGLLGSGKMGSGPNPSGPASQTPLAMLQQELPAMREKCLAAIETRDLVTLKNMIHQLNGAAGFCKLNALQTAAAAVELAVDTQDWNAILARWPEVAACMKYVGQTNQE